MKTLLISLAFLFAMTFSFFGTVNAVSTSNNRAAQIQNDPGYYYEYVCINGEWYKITYNSEGGVVEVVHVPIKD